jgi:hypothetical protein
MKKLYHLQDDRKTIDEMQRGMKSKDKLIGLKNTHGLFGSDKWWKAISKNKLQLLTLTGTITKTWSGHHDDFPEFQLSDKNGEVTTWPMESMNLHNNLGSKIEIDYVIQSLKASGYENGEAKCIIEVRC